MSDRIMLYHATDVSKINSIATEGLRAKSYWTDDFDILAYYEETVADEGGAPITLVINMTALDAIHIEPDFPGIEEPLTFTLGVSEDAISDAWEASDKTWTSSLQIIKTLRYCAIISAENIMVMNNAGEMQRLTDYAAGLMAESAIEPAPV